jgi:hypothetical protein
MQNSGGCSRPSPRLRRQTHMHCTVCQDVAEFYDQIHCHNCGNCYKWSVPWKNEPRLILVELRKLPTV